MRGIDISINISIWEEWRKESEYKYKYVNIDIDIGMRRKESEYKGCEHERDVRGMRENMLRKEDIRGMNDDEGYGYKYVDMRRMII